MALRILSISADGSGVRDLLWQLSRTLLNQLRRDTEVAAEEGTEGAKALEAAFQADICHAAIAPAKKKPRAVQPLAGQELMRCSAERVAKRAEEMIRRQTCRSRGLLQGHPLGKRRENVVPSARNTAQ